MRAVLIRDHLAGFDDGVDEIGHRIFVGDRRQVRPDRPSFSNPFLAEIRVGRRGFHMHQANIRYIGRSGEKIIRQGRCQRLTLAVVTHFLEQRRTDPLCGATI